MTPLELAVARYRRARRVLLLHVHACWECSAGEMCPAGWELVADSAHATAYRRRMEVELERALMREPHQLDNRDSSVIYGRDQFCRSCVYKAGAVREGLKLTGPCEWPECMPRDYQRRIGEEIGPYPVAAGGHRL